MKAVPTDLELEILKCFWREADLSAREVHERIGGANAWTVSTTRTFVDRMWKKGLLRRRTLHGVAVFSAADAKIDVLESIARRMTRIFEIDGGLPAAAFTGSQILSAEDIAELEAVLRRTAPESDEDVG